MEDWKQHTDMAKQLLSEGQLAAALEQSKSALKIAELMLSNEKQNSLTVFILSQRNLANIYLKLDLQNFAKEHLEQSHKTVIRLAEAPQTTDHLREDAQRSSEKTYDDLLKFYRNHSDLFSRKPVMRKVYAA